MAELDKAIHDLENNVIYDEYGIAKITKEAVLSIVELLKEKQPRLLTLEEIKQAEVIWCEYGSIEGHVVCMLMDKIDSDGDYRLTEPNGCIIYFAPSEYNESWRCWSARPTDEQMKETEWDGDGE